MNVAIKKKRERDQPTDFKFNEVILFSDKVNLALIIIRDASLLFPSHERDLMTIYMKALINESSVYRPSFDIVNY